MLILFDHMKTYREVVPCLSNVSACGLARKAAWVGSMSVTYCGKTPAETAFGRRPPGIHNGRT
eukprot:10385917-Prorocentrum_lima.AAC.1